MGVAAYDAGDDIFFHKSVVDDPRAPAGEQQRLGLSSID